MAVDGAEWHPVGGFVAELVAGRNVSEAAARAGISGRTAARWHREPEVQAELERMRLWCRRSGSRSAPPCGATASV